MNARAIPVVVLAAALAIPAGTPAEPRAGAAGGTRPEASAAAAGGWQRLDPAAGPAPSARRNATAVFDPAGRRMIVFGGLAQSGERNDVWSFAVDTPRWTQLAPAAGPSPDPRFAHTAVFDTAASRMIVWSGQGGPFFDDVWSFDPAAPSWTLLSPSGTIPAARYGSTAVYDPVGGTMLTFAGFTTAGRFDDVRSLDPAVPSWTDRTPAGGGPLKRCLHAASFDAAANAMYVYGGQNAGFLDDLWRFDAGAGAWADLTGPGRPPGRLFPTAVSLDAGLVIFGGNTAAGRVNETWIYRPADSSWTLATGGGAPPAARDGHAACAEPDGSAMYIFGGSDDVFFGDVWRYDPPLTSAGGRDPVPPADGFALLESYPNPFNASTTIRFELPRSAPVRLEIVDLGGAVVAVLHDGPAAPGRTEMVFDAAGLPSGVYFARLAGPEHSPPPAKLLLVR